MNDNCVNVDFFILNFYTILKIYAMKGARLIDEEENFTCSNDDSYYAKAAFDQVSKAHTSLDDFSARIQQNIHNQADTDHSADYDLNGNIAVSGLTKPGALVVAVTEASGTRWLKKDCYTYVSPSYYSPATATADADDVPEDIYDISEGDQVTVTFHEEDEVYIFDELNDWTPQ